MASKKDKKSKEETLEQILWNCRVALRGVGTTDKNRDAVIGLVFIKFASDKFEKVKNKIIEENKDKLKENDDLSIFTENPIFYRAESVFYLKEESRWSYIVSHASSKGIAVIIDKALAEIEASNPELKGALTHNFYTSLGAPNTKLKDLIDNINKIDESRFHEEDLIGRVYEYFLRLYAAAGVKEDGEFYTPASIVKLIAELIEPYKGVVYDPCCGSGGMFVQSMKFIDSHKGNRIEVSIKGQESQAETWRLCKMNLAIRGISCNLGEKNASTFLEDLHKDTTVDFIMANPPFNLKDWRKKDELLDDERWSGYGIPSYSNANYAWILHMISKLDVNHGIAGFLLANGALNDPEHLQIRKQIIENDKVEAIIVMPRDMFYSTDISVTLWILNMNKKQGEANGRKLRDRTGEILFIDLRRWDENIEEIVIDVKQKKKKIVLSDSQIAKVKEIYNNWQGIDRSKYNDIPELCKSATLDGENGLRANNYNLAPSKYIEFIDHDLDIDYDKEMKRIQKEMKDLLQEEKETQIMLQNAFKGIGYGIN